ncbi:VanZ family protein [Bradyrhizobium japonicum]|uniref:VanZ family protein n=1 Tax=Bradyrhizobium japonicum TaxID=375 RepID=UPI001BAC8141|nr:VanZ family protein [Bradyrhizobium japonicum]MBR0994308.1 VanZ family protein [Bradyrhizobium japonicum]
MDTSPFALHKRGMNGSILKTALAIAAWGSVSLIGYATLTKVQFIYAVYGTIKPFLWGLDMATWAHLEHAIAFLTLGSLFALAYPRRTPLICLVVVGSAITFELLQTLTPDRHGTVFDVSEKIVAGCAGIAAVRLVQVVRSARRKPETCASK